MNVVVQEIQHDITHNVMPAVMPLHFFFGRRDEVAQKFEGTPFLSLLSADW
jgi:hypothetical protein